MSDALGDRASTSSSDSWAPIVPSDDTDLPRLNGRFPRAISCGGDGGAVVARDANGTDATFFLGQGAEKAIRPSRVLATGTTATGLVALY